MKADLGDGSDNFDYTTELGKEYTNKLELNAGSGNDVIVVHPTAGTINAVINGEAGDDQVTLHSAPDDTNPQGSTITVDLGAGNDLLTVYTNAADAAETLNVTGGEGLDTLYLTGCLAPPEHVAGGGLNIQGDNSRIHLQLNQN